MAKPKAIDIVARKGNKKLAFEIETGKNSLDQIVENLSKSLAAGCDRVYLVPTSKKGLKRIYKILDKKGPWSK